MLIPSLYYANKMLIVCLNYTNTMPMPITTGSLQPIMTADTDNVMSQAKTSKGITVELTLDATGIFCNILHIL